MNKTEYDLELDRLWVAAGKLVESEQIGYDTAIFLDKESKKLESIINDKESSESEIEDAIKKLVTLQKRVLSEMNHVKDNDIAMSIVEQELTEVIAKGYNE